MADDPNPNPDPDPDPDPDAPATLEEATARIRELERGNSDARKDAQKRREQLERAEGELAKLKAKDQTEVERLKGDVDRLTSENSGLVSQLRRSRVERVLLQAAAGKFADPDDALRLRDELEDDADEQDDRQLLRAATKAVDDLLEAKPHYGVSNGDTARGARTQGVRQRGGDPKDDPSSWIRGAVRR
jgi:chromosome segregation ATPase